MRFFILWDAKNLRDEDYKEGRTEDYKISSLTSRICKTILDSREEFDALEFVSKFDRKDIVIEDLRQAYFWKLINLHKNKKIKELFDGFTYYAENFSKLGPSYWHSEILKLAYRTMVNENSTKFIPFMIKWDYLGNLSEKDWVKEIGDDGNEYPPLAVKCAKKCFEILKAQPKNSIPNATLIWLKELYEKVRNKDSNDDWNVRNYATISAWCGDVEEAITLYKSLLLNMGEKYYLWSELANMFQNNNDLKIGLLLKAKSLEKNEDFLGEIHLTLASLWQENGCGTLANKELQIYAKHREEKRRNYHARFYELQRRATIDADNSKMIDLNFYISMAEDYVYGDYDWCDFVIIDKWILDKVERCNLSDGKGTSICIKSNKFPILRKCEPGDIVKIRCYTVEEKKLIHIHW